MLTAASGTTHSCCCVRVFVLLLSSLAYVPVPRSSFGWKSSLLMAVAEQRSGKLVCVCVMEQQVATDSKFQKVVQESPLLMLLMLLFLQQQEQHHCELRDDRVLPFVSGVVPRVRD